MNNKSQLAEEYVADLERMVTQIARNVAAFPPAPVSTAIADHLLRFWDPAMRRDLIDAVSSGRIKVADAVRDAIEQLRPPGRYPLTPARPST